MRVFIVASELTPIAKVGGLGDVIGALPKALFKKGLDVSVIIPKYGLIDENRYNLQSKLDFEVRFKNNSEKVTLFSSILPGSKVKVYFLHNQKYLSGTKQIYFSKSAFCNSWKEINRFRFFSRAVAVLLKKKILKADIIHCHDWHTGLLVKLSPLPALFTIHNLANQGQVGRSPNYMKIGIKYATIINTVSPTYAREVLSPRFSEGLEKIMLKRRKDFFGVLNGIDYQLFDPKSDKYIYAQYNFKNLEKKEENKLKLEKEIGLKPNSKYTLLGIISRLTKQKGIDLAVKVLKKVLKKNIYLVVLGIGGEKRVSDLKKLKKLFPRKVSLHFEFNAPLAQKIYAASDIFLMPSRFEPCGLGQMIAMRYGTIPVARKTGGLSDTIQDGKNGFLFRGLKSEGLHKKILEALDLYKNKNNWQEIIKNAMESDFSWDKSAQDYIKLYKLAIKNYGRK